MSSQFPRPPVAAAPLLRIGRLPPVYNDQKTNLILKSKTRRKGPGRNSEGSIFYDRVF